MPGAIRLSAFDPALSYKFAIEIAGITESFFTSCEGLKLEREVVDYKEGGTNNFIYKFPGRMKQENIRLKRGVTFSPALWDWFMTGARTGTAIRKNLSVLVSDPAGIIAQRWDVLSAWPVRYEGPELRADKHRGRLELVEFAHHGLTL